MGEAYPKDVVGVGGQQSRCNRGTLIAIAFWPVLTEIVGQVIARFLSRLFQRKSCRPETTELICTRLTPYFTITHPTRGTLPGPFFKLPAAHRRLMLDAVVTMVYDRAVRTAAAEFLSAVEKSLAGQEDKEYWDQISRRS